MGYELWISPITGYRRKGTRLAEMRALFAAGVQARAILEPLQCCPADAPASEMKRILEKRGFDVAGVQQKRGGPVIGYVEKDQLQGGNASEHLRQVNSEQLVSDSTSISEVLAELRSKERVFVVVGAGVKGIITRADLNKPPIRIYLFGLISLLEMHLRYWVRAAYGDESWETKLNAKRLETAKNLQEVRRTRNDQISLLACLQFSDLRQLVLAAEEIRTKLNFGSKTKGKELLENAEELRNRLAHSQDDLVEGKSWEQLIDLVESIYGTVSISDENVEERVRSAGNNTTSLWVAG
jgi:CBS domain-containing protein